VKHDCTACMKLCPHGKKKTNCTVCSGCEHGKNKYKCAACKAARAGQPPPPRKRKRDPEIKPDPEIKQEPRSSPTPRSSRSPSPSPSAVTSVSTERSRVRSNRGGRAPTRR
jgi:predicted  nucleic acid-binding Zn-ribbon protein